MNKLICRIKSISSPYERTVAYRSNVRPHLGSEIPEWKKTKSVLTALIVVEDRRGAPYRFFIDDSCSEEAFYELYAELVLASDGYVVITYDPEKIAPIGQRIERIVKFE